MFTNNQCIAFQFSFLNVESQFEAVFQKGLQHPAFVLLVGSLGESGLNVKAIVVRPFWADDLAEHDSTS